MKGVANILENDATLIAMLNDGANSVYQLIADQNAGYPHLVIDEAGNNPNPTFSGASTLDVVQTRVFCVASQLYDGNSGVGVTEVAGAVRDALDAVTGTYDTEVIADIDFNDSSTHTEGDPDHLRNVVEQVYMVTKRR